MTITVKPDPAHALGGQQIGQAIGLALERAKGVALDPAVLPQMDQGQAIGVALGPLVADVDANVVACRHLPGEAGAKLVVAVGGGQHGRQHSQSAPEGIHLWSLSSMS